jgi:hypothetical protein
MNPQQETANPLHTMDSDQLLSALVLSDRAQNYEDFIRIRGEIMYRLRCAEPLVNWYKPTRLEK